MDFQEHQMRITGSIYAALFKSKTVQALSIAATLGAMAYAFNTATDFLYGESKREMTELAEMVRSAPMRGYTIQKGDTIHSICDDNIPLGEDEFTQINIYHPIKESIKANTCIDRIVDANNIDVNCSFYIPTKDGFTTGCTYDLPEPGERIVIPMRE